MSYAADILRRRQELQQAFRPRYNPLEGVMSEIMAIEEGMFKREGEEAKRKMEAEKLALERQGIEAKRKMEAEKLGLEKTQTEARTKQLQAQAETEREDRAALAEERRQRGLQWEAEAAATKRKTEQERLDEQKKAVFEKAYGMMRGAGLPGPGATPVSKKQLDELGATVGLTGDEVLAGLEQIETERSKLGAGLGLIEAKTEREKAAGEAQRRKGLPKPPKVLTPEEQQAAKEEALYKKLRNKRLERALSEKGGFVPTEEEVNKMQTARRQVIAAQASTNVLRQLMNKYPDFKDYVGPVDGLINGLRAKFGASSKEAAEVRSAINRVFQAYKVATTGAAAGVLEMEDLKNIMPKETDNFDAIIGKLDAAERMAQTSVDTLDFVLDKMDIRAADPLARGIAVTPSSAAAPAVSPMSDDELDQYEVQ